MATEAVVQEGFIDVGHADSIMLCTDMVALAGDDAAADAVDASVLAAATVPGGSLVQVDEVTARGTTDYGVGGRGGTPRAMVRITCRDPRINDAVAAASRRDPARRAKSVLVWIFRVVNPDGTTLDYRFRARLVGVAFYDDGPDRVVIVHVRSLDAVPTVTRLRSGSRPGPG